MQATGRWKVLFDGTSAVLGSSGAAITLAAGQRIYLGAYNPDPYANPARIQPGGNFLSYNTSGNSIGVTVGGETRLAVSEQGVLANLLRPVSKVYTESGDISSSDRLAVVDSESLACMVLASGLTDGQDLIIKRLGVGEAVITLTLDTWADSTITLGGLTTKEAAGLVWMQAKQTWLLLNLLPTVGPLLQIQYGRRKASVVCA